MGFFDYFKKNKILKTNNEYLSDPKETVAENNSAATRRENPLYTVKGYINEQKIHLGSYFLNPGDWEECYLVFENNDWYLNRESWWPVHRGASNGGKFSKKLNAGYLIFNNIYTLDDLLEHIYRGNIAPCFEQLKTHKNVLSLLDELVKSKLTPNYDVDGLSLLWEYDESQTGIIIYKCFSCNRDAIVVPSKINNCPVVAFGHRAFVGMMCRELILPDTLKELNGIAGCKHITEITIPPLTKECCSFLGCDSLENIFVADGNTSFSSVDGVLYTHDHTELLRCPPRKSGLLRISDKTTSLGSYACADCQLLTDVILPSTLTEIGLDAFQNCVNISAFVLPDSITKIEWGAFANIDRNRIICKEGSYAHNYLDKNFSNPNWQGKYK